MLPHTCKQSFIWFRIYLIYFNELSNLLAIYREADLSKMSMSCGIICFHLICGISSVASISSLFAKEHSRCKLSSKRQKWLEANPKIPEPESHGWKIDKEKQVIEWMSNPPAPDTGLELLSYSCFCACVNRTCVCIMNGLQCTDLCRLITCENMTRNERES